MKKATLRDLSMLLGITLLIFYPLFYARYCYTDEIIQLRNYRKGSNFHMFAGQGRYLTDLLFQKLFSSIDTIRQITCLRLFSLFGWIVCIPVWYLALTRISRKEGLPRLLPFLTVLYLVTCPPFCVYVSWSSCMELFIANTSGLLAGYTLYSQMKFRPITGSNHEHMELSAVAVVVTLLFGLVSLFTYQNGFGCFLLPFLLHAIAKKQWTRTLGTALGLYFVTYLLYYGLFHWQLQRWHIDAVGRTAISTDPLRKIAFFLVRPLAAAFRFTWIAKEDDRLAVYIPQCILLAWLLVNFFSRRSRAIASPTVHAHPGRSRFFYLTGIGGLLCLIYLPSLIVHENYASNRTLLGLDLAVFILVFSTLLSWVRTEKHRLIVAGVTGILLVAHGWYNFRYEFLHPVEKEYEMVRNYIETQYHPGITQVTFIRPSQQLFVNLYGVNISWDEFGVPSNFPIWSPEDFVKQVVWEQTGNRRVADSLNIVNLPHEQAYLLPGPKHDSSSASPATAHPLTIDVEKIMQE